MGNQKQCVPPGQPGGSTQQLQRVKRPPWWIEKGQLIVGQQRRAHAIQRIPKRQDAILDLLPGQDSPWNELKRRCSPDERLPAENCRRKQQQRENPEQMQ
jgi:hypothetical protein